jgi:hypothetical protein
MGLMIHFRRPHTNIGYIVMCPVLIAFAGSTMILCQRIAVMAAAEQGQIAAVLSRLGPFGYVDRAVGNSICGAIWTNSLSGTLQRLVPENYVDLTVQLSYPMGNPGHEAILEGIRNCAMQDVDRRYLCHGSGTLLRPDDPQHQHQHLQERAGQGRLVVEREASIVMRWN